MAKLQIRAGIVIALMLSTLAGVRGASRSKHRQVRNVMWDRVPYRLGPWTGTEARFDPVFGVDPADSSLLRIYRTYDLLPIIVYVGFHGDLPTSLDYHTPVVCYPAQGWQIVSTGKSSLGAFRGNPVQASEIVVEKGGERRLVVWWYHAGSQSFEKRIRQVYMMVALAMFTGRTDGSIVRVEVPLAQGSEEAVREELQRFSRLLLPALEDALPQ